MPVPPDADLPQPQAVCIGETMALVAPVDGRPLALTERVELMQAGAESNVARYLTDLGVRTAWVSAVGADPLGERVTAELARTGVDVRWVEQRDDAPTGVFFKNPTSSGTSVHYYRTGSAASLMSPEDVDRWPLAEASWLHLTGITPALSPSCSRMIEEVLRQGSGRATTSFDVNYRPQLWPDSHTAAERLRELAGQADVVLVGRDEAEELWGTPTADAVAELLGTTTCIVVKDSDQEAVEILRSADGTTVTRAPAKRVEVVEPVGAGDAFAAGYIAATLRGAPAAERLALGHSVAAWTLGTPGDYRAGHGPTVRE